MNGKGSKHDFANGVAYVHRWISLNTKKMCIQKLYVSSKEHFVEKKR